MRFVGRNPIFPLFHDNGKKLKFYGLCRLIKDSFLRDAYSVQEVHGHDEWPKAEVVHLSRCSFCLASYLLLLSY